MNQTKLTLREKLAYAGGELGQQLSTTYVNSFLMVFFVNILKIPPLTAGTIFLAATIWDAINDPIMGIICDRTRTRWGSYRPWIIAFTLPASVFLILCFTPWPVNGTGSIVLVTVIYILYGMTNTLIKVPFGVLNTVITTDTMDRASLGIFRNLGSGIGGLVMSTAALKVVEYFSGGPDPTGKGYQFGGIFLALLAVVIIIPCTLILKERVVPPVKKTTPRDSLMVLKGNIPAFCLIAVAFLQQFFCNSRISWMAYYCKNVIGNPSHISTLITIMFLAPFGSLLYAQPLIRRIGKRNVFILAGVLMIVSGFILLTGTSTATAYAGIIASAITYSLLPAVLWGALPDAADYGEWKNHARAPSFIYVCGTFAIKAALSFGGFITGIVLTIVNFNNADGAIQTAQTISGIHAYYAWCPVVVGILIILCMIPYRLSVNQCHNIAAELDARRKQEV